MPYKIRIQKKKEDSPIPGVGLGERLFEGVLERPQLVWGGIAAVILAGAFTFYSQNAKEQDFEAAWAIEAEASKYLREPAPLPQPIGEGEEDLEPEPVLDEEGRRLKSITLYGDIIQQFPNSDAAALALIERGNAYYRLKKWDQAKQAYDDFLEGYPSKNRLQTLVQLKLAYLNLSQGNQSDARTLFDALYELPAHPLKDEAGYELARIYELEGKTDLAVKIYTAISESELETPWSVEAKARLIPHKAESTTATSTELKIKTVGEFKTVDKAPKTEADEPVSQNESEISPTEE